VSDKQIGFDVTDPTTAKLQDLQNQITALQNQMNHMQRLLVTSTGRDAPAPSAPRPDLVSSADDPSA
jgi:hypothetical protein